MPGADETSLTFAQKGVSIKSLFKFWIKGWCIIGRLWIFGMMVWVLTLPFRFIPVRFRRISCAEELNPEYLPTFVFFALFIMGLPFIFSIAGKATGEFMIPKKTINEIIMRNTIRRGMNSVHEKE